MHAFADAIQRTHKDKNAKRNIPSIGQSFYLLNTRIVCAIFPCDWMQCVNGFSLLIQRFVRKVNDAKNSAILKFSLLPKEIEPSWIQHKGSCSKQLRPIALAENCPFLSIHSLEFQEIWQNNSSETTWMIYCQKAEVWCREFSIIQHAVKTTSDVLQNFITTVLTERIWCQFLVGKMIKKSNDFGLVFNQSSCHGNFTHLRQNARMKSFKEKACAEFCCHKIAKKLSLK